jgi:hypothetical protein
MSFISLFSTETPLIIVNNDVFSGHKQQQLMAIICPKQHQFDAQLMSLMVYFMAETTLINRANHCQLMSLHVFLLSILWLKHTLNLVWTMILQRLTLLVIKLPYLKSTMLCSKLYIVLIHCY